MSTVFPLAKPWEERRFGECAYPIPAKNWLWSCCNKIDDLKGQYCKPCRQRMYVPRAVKAK